MERLQMFLIFGMILTALSVFISLAFWIATTERLRQCDDDDNDCESEWKTGRRRSILSFWISCALLVILYGIKDHRETPQKERALITASKKT